MWLSNTWHLVRLWDGWSPIAWQDLREISGWPLVVQVDNVSNVHLDHVTMLLIAPACVPVLYFCARQSRLILVTAPKFFLYEPQHQIFDWYKIFGRGLFVVSKVQVSFLEKEGRGRRGGVNICNPVQRRQCLATLCLGLPLGQADWGISRLRQRLLTET